VIVPAAPATPTKPAESIKTAPKPASEEVSGPAPATIIVNLPAEAKLLVDEHATTSTSTTRVFASPALERGRDFSYTLTAELVLDGRPVQTSKSVTVRAGEETRVELVFPTASVAQR